MKEKFEVTRRKFLKSASLLAMAGALNVKNVGAASRNRKRFKVLDEKDRFDIHGKGQEIIQKAYDLGYLYEDKHKGCARCTVAALQDAIDFIPADEALFRTASCLDGGATPDNSASCGAFTGSGMVIGWLCGTERFGDNSLSHELIHKVHKRFKEEHGSVICKKVRKSADGKCPEVVGMAAKWTAEILLRQFSQYE